jgi:hypothetical protein
VWEFKRNITNQKEKKNQKFLDKTLEVGQLFSAPLKLSLFP